MVGNTAEIAEREGLHKTFVSAHLRLALLAPALVECALRGEWPRNVTLLVLFRDGVLLCLAAQHKQLHR